MFYEEEAKIAARGLAKVVQLELDLPCEQAFCLLYGVGETAKELRAILKGYGAVCHMRADRKNQKKYDAIIMFRPMKSEQIAELICSDGIVVDASPYNAEQIHELSAFKEYRRIRIISVAQQF